jgi:hypothetical protein
MGKWGSFTMFWRKRKRESWSMSMSMREEKGVELYIVGGEWNMRRVFCQCLNQKKWMIRKERVICTLQSSEDEDRVTAVI